MSTITSFRQISNNLPKSLDQVAKDPQVKRESDYYLANIKNIKSIDDFLGNDRIYRYAMKAFGLEEMTYAKAFIRKALTEGIDKSDSFANKLADPRYKDFVEAFNFARYGSGTTVFSRTQQGTVDRYVRQTLEEQAGEDNDGVRLALYFQRKASTVTTPYSLLADKALLKVTQVMLGLPEASGSIAIERQADLITKKLNLDDLKDPAKLDKLLTRFSALWDIDNAPPNPMLSLFSSGDSGSSIGSDLLSQVQKLRRG
jgi:hypothetical protein